MKPKTHRYKKGSWALYYGNEYPNRQGQRVNILAVWNNGKAYDIRFEDGFPEKYTHTINRDLLKPLEQ